ncbi:hypothetical protein STEG23_003372 [Scotinomys teguina]
MHPHRQFGAQLTLGIAISPGTQPYLGLESMLGARRGVPGVVLFHDCIVGRQRTPDTLWYENLIFDKDAKTVKWKKESIFNKWCWHNWMATCRRLQIDPYLSPCTKLKSKWIKDLNINPVTLNLIEEKVGSTLECIGTGDHFLNITPTAQTLSAIINQWDYMKLRSFCKAKDTITKTKHQPTEWEKIFTNPTSDRGLISRIYKELKKHDIKTSNSPIEKWAIELNREFTAEEYRMAERH